MKTWTQLVGMIRYELLMQWRRRLLPIIVVSVLGLVVFGVAIQIEIYRAMIPLFANAAPDEIIKVPVDTTIGQDIVPITAAKAQTTIATHSLSSSLLLYAMMAILIMSVMFAETIPRDRQIQVRDLLDSLPLSRAAYLAGKLLSVWAGILIGTLAGVVFGGVMGWAVFGPFDLAAYLALWAVAVTAPILFVTGVAVLLAAGQPTRRRAAMVGAGLLPVYFVVNVLVVVNLFNVAVLVDPIYQSFSMAATFHWSVEDVTAQITATLGGMVVTMALAWAGTWAWQRWRAGEA